VRTPEGELTFQSFGEVERAYLQGLVDPEDELLEEGTTKWRKANTFPLLVQARRHGNAVWEGTQMAWMVVTMVVGSTAMYLIFKGIAKENWLQTSIGFLLAITLGVLLTRVTMKAFKRTRPHG
jgi:hypothetical protein